MNSLRGRLLLWLMGAVALIGVVGGYFIYRNALTEAHAFFDYQLRVTALLLRDQAYGFAPRSGLPEEVPEYDFVVQVWTLDGNRIYLSQPKALLPTAAPLGFATEDTAGGRWRLFSVLAPGHLIQVAQSFKVREQRAARLALRTLAPFGLLIPALVLMIWWIVGRALEPLRQVTQSVKSRRPEALAPLPVEGLPAEVTPLVAAINELLGRLGKTLDKERAFIADAAHELRSPLTALDLQLQNLTSSADAPARSLAQEQLRSGVARATRLVEQLLSLARQQGEGTRQPAELALDELARELVVEALQIADRKRIDLGLDAPTRVTVSGEPDSLRALLRNLLDNALRYTPDGGQVDVAVRRESASGQDSAVLEVTDSGPGIPEPERARVFDRFYRVPGTVSAGSGIGLAIVKAVADRHGAQVEITTPTRGHGTTVRVRFGGASAA
jgi:two-component system OmpR family sensor kinase